MVTVRTEIRLFAHLEPSKWAKSLISLVWPARSRWSNRRCHRWVVKERPPGGRKSRFGGRFL